MQSRSFTAVEGAVALAVVGSVLAVTIPVFAANLRASRLAEPVDGLRRIAASAVAVAEAGGVEASFPGSAPLTPDDVPRGIRANDPPGVWDHPTWKALGFGFDHAHAFSFAFDSDATPRGSHFRASAHGDLDGDGVRSTFEVEGVADARGARVLPGLYVDREVE